MDIESATRTAAYPEVSVVGHETATSTDTPISLRGEVAGTPKTFTSFDFPSRDIASGGLPRLKRYGTPPVRELLRGPQRRGRGGRVHFGVLRERQKNPRLALTKKRRGSSPPSGDPKSSRQIIGSINGSKPPFYLPNSLVYAPNSPEYNPSSLHAADYRWNRPAVTTANAVDTLQPLGQLYDSLATPPHLQYQHDSGVLNQDEIFHPKSQPSGVLFGQVAQSADFSMQPEHQQNIRNEWDNTPNSAHSWIDSPPVFQRKRRPKFVLGGSSDESTSESDNEWSTSDTHGEKDKKSKVRDCTP